VYLLVQNDKGRSLIVLSYQKRQDNSKLQILKRYSKAKRMQARREEGQGANAQRPGEFQGARNKLVIYVNIIFLQYFIIYSVYSRWL